MENKLKENDELFERMIEQAKEELVLILDKYDKKIKDLDYVGAGGMTEKKNIKVISQQETIRNLEKGRVAERKRILENEIARLEGKIING